MRTLLGALCLALLASTSMQANDPIPTRGLCIQAPAPDQFDRFLSFIDSELAPRGINLLVLRIDYNFEYESHPELIGPNPLTRSQVERLVATSRSRGIELVPQINLLGHQSWQDTLGMLLEVYPDFDETPGVRIPEKYEWPNDDGLYCKSYCPLHPEVHDVVFALVDEVMDAFQATGFHAGMDEVFYIGHENCPRCAGKDKAKLFADEVTKIRAHLAKDGRTLFIWGDRLIDGKTTGIGFWEASENGTHPAIDRIPKDVVICDWHYERAETTPAYFALKGFDVLSCPWNKVDVALAHREQIERFRANSNAVLSKRFRGILHTYWSSAESFMDIFEDPTEFDEQRRGAIDAFRALFPARSANSESE